MTTNSGVKGKTVEQLRRSQDAAERKILRSVTTTEEQLATLDGRTGTSAREVARLSKGLDQ